MRWLGLYLRSRRVPVTLALTTGSAVLIWTLWSLFSDTRDVDLSLVVLTVLLMVAALTATLSGPDDAWDRTGALPWLPRRAAHLLAALALVVVPLLATQLTGARFLPAGIVLRDAIGLLGLTALGATAIGTARAWFLPLGWTLTVLVFPGGDSWGQIATWQVQAPDNRAAALTAGVLGAAGLLAYAVAGPLRRGPAETAA